MIEAGKAVREFAEKENQKQTIENTNKVEDGLMAMLEEVK